MATISYVPFAVVQRAFGIVVSQLAAHTANLLAQRSASVLVVDDDRELQDSYARRRFSIGVTPWARMPGSEEADAIWSALEARHGETVRILRTLPDFAAISLEPGAGRLVLGFATAHDVAGATIKEMLR